jgi:redox-sensitive bicupin YhaK (pirin superfamily)
MTAGRGLVHAEVSPQSFKESGGPLEILQLWLNLPAKLKMVDPHYVGLQRSEIPVVMADGGKVRVNLIAGNWDGQKGPYVPLVDVHMTWIEMTAGGRIEPEVAAARNVFLYIVRGELKVAGQSAIAFHLIELNNDGDGVTLEAGTDAVLLFGHAQPFGEPVVAQGPFVMNTREEIRQAMMDYQAGKFGGLPRM